MQVQSAIAAFGARLVSGTNASPRQEGQDTATSTASPEASGTRRYDFSNVSPGELREAVNRLIRSGDLDLHETSSLLGIMAPPEARLRVDGTPLAKAEGEQIDATPIDVFAKLREGIAGARWRHDDASEAALAQAMAALQRVQGRVSAVDLRA